MDTGSWKVEKGVPIPGGWSKYPFAEMQVGDSFAVPESWAQKVRSAACHYGRRKGGRYLVRKDGDGGYRCWRVE